jgi:hypothetical protein
LTGTGRHSTVYAMVKSRAALSILVLLATAIALKTSAQVNTAGPAIEYRNAQYGFCFSLPGSWKGYSVLAEEWKGSPPDSRSFTKGPLLRIRHPHWTEQDPHEDVPIMVFTHAQWRLVEKEQLIVSAAPFGPSELGRNGRYVFALPPRFDYDFATGREEVEALIRNKSLHAPCGKRASE